MNEEEIVEILRLKPDGRLFHREGQTLEFKEQFNFAGLAEYFKDFSAFANNKGGLIVFGVTDAPREAVGLTEKSILQFEKLDPERISAYLLENFSGHIEWENDIFKIRDRVFGAFKVLPALTKPVIAKKNEGKEDTIRNGEIYFRYSGRTQKIRYSELEEIVSERIELNNKEWISRVSEIGMAGPSSAAVLDLDRSTITKNDKRILVVDDELTKKIKFIKEGEFVEKGGSKTLKLIGDVQPIDSVEVVKTVKENLLKQYPLSATELARRVRKKFGCGINDVWKIIASEGIKSNPTYAAYNFRNLDQEKKYEKTGKVSNSMTSIYREEAVDYIGNIFNIEQEKNK